jgi:hypothetical protein
VGDPQPQLLFQAMGNPQLFEKIIMLFKNRGNPYLVSENQTLLMIKIDIG